ncbi:hypothetical protein BCR44DRAFT_34200 [Catenaria anguillulae PL171]|uniref:Uncharacterized protein n=1 Tax=Catenaria anguillulae PL171 TaxID=765915 RepID=A0A1Y2HNQ1_9FUNG|nr:hypothetical protein BCR44DRAFT_34200 [Catenaria anguillulae PL171]
MTRFGTRSQFVSAAATSSSDTTAAPVLLSAPTVPGRHRHELTLCQPQPIVPKASTERALISQRDDNKLSRV